jgi:hypothetical protein
MSCPNCHKTPCGCFQNVRPGKDPVPAPTVCDPYPTPLSKCMPLKEPNVWIERGDNSGSENAPGICLLDTMSEEQVIFVLERDQKARVDLLKVTNDPRLLELARTVEPLPTQEEMDMHQKWFNRSDSPTSIPFYAIFRGQPPFAQ